MPELPEVEVVRLGLERGILGRRIAAVEVRHPRAIRRHLAGESDLTARLLGRRVVAARRRGKYLWFPLDSGDALAGHLGMSGQLLVVASAMPEQAHLRVRIAFDDGDPELRFIDQRTFGGLSVLTADEPGHLPAALAHVACDPLDPDFDQAAFLIRLRRRRSGVKRALLDQRLISGVGNIYADESLWRARLHYARATETLRRGEAIALLRAVREVLVDALVAGGTSFDALYVDTAGRSGQFERELAVYGRAGQPCLRCATAIRRDPFMNRSSYTCPRCQPRPRRPHP